MNHCLVQSGRATSLTTILPSIIFGLSSKTRADVFPRLTFCSFCITAGRQFVIAAARHRGSSSSRQLVIWLVLLQYVYLHVGPFGCWWWFVEAFVPGTVCYRCSSITSATYYNALVASLCGMAIIETILTKLWFIVIFIYFCWSFSRNAKGIWWMEEFKCDNEGGYSRIC